MEAVFAAEAWGSPVGLALFLFFSGAGMGIFFWGLSHLNKGSKEE